MEQIEGFVVDFFKNLKCDVSKSGDIIIVRNVPKSFEDLFGQSSPYKLSFNSNTMVACGIPSKVGTDVPSLSGNIFVGKGSPMLAAINKFLDGAGKTTLLKIDFDCDAEKEILKAISLKNCEISNLTKKHKNNFFSRFTFMTTFRYLNESEQVISEIYVHNGDVVDGDLSGYKVLDGDGSLASSKNLEKDYNVARIYLKNSLAGKTVEISEFLGKKVDVEINRIRDHYKNSLNELGGDLSGILEKIQETELALRAADDGEKNILRSKLERLRRGLVRAGDDEARDKVLKEQDFTIKDAMYKYSLSVDNKLINTTIIYYPIFNFNLFLRSGKNSGRYIDMSYDPLTKTLNDINCDGCGVKISNLNLCGSGHLCCEGCMRRCGECGDQFCVKCLTRYCNVCGKPICKDCSKICLGCGKNVCLTHMRKDAVSGEERCANCLRPCMRCHDLSNPKYFGKAMDGSKICQKCLSAERRGNIIKKVFRN